MSVIAWDGKVLAADTQGTMGGLKFSTSKIQKVNGDLLGFTGDLDSGLALVEWYRKKKTALFPECQKDKDRWAPLLVITKQKKILRYEREPFPIEIKEKFFSVGSGRDFALTAMYLGNNSKKAVECAIRFEASCGGPIEELKL